MQEGDQTFDLERHTCLSTDWSKIGIGYVLFQKHCDCVGPLSPNCGGGHWQLVYARSRFTRDAESHGLQSCRMFILGSPNLLVTTDHKPLTRIFNNTSLDSINKFWVRNFKEKSLMYQFTIEHIEGGSTASRIGPLKTLLGTLPTPRLIVRPNQQMQHSQSIKEIVSRP